MKWMCLVVLLLPLSLAATEDVRVRMQLLSHQGEAIRADAFEPVVGERIILAVDVMTTSWFTKAPRVPHLVIRDMIVLKDSVFSTNFSERIEGVTYAVQRREYSLFAQRAGSYTLHGIDIEVPVASAAKGENTFLALRTQPLQLSVKPLPHNTAVESLEGRSNYLSSLLPTLSPPPTPSSSWVAEAVHLSQAFSSSLEDLTVGDIVERRVSIRASGTLGMLIAPMHWPRSGEFSQRSLTSEIIDNTNRGEFIGTRTEVRQYTLLNEGQVTLPALSVSWWDGADWQLNTLSAKALTVNAVPDRATNLSEQILLLRDQLLKLPRDVFFIIALLMLLVMGLWMCCGGYLVTRYNRYRMRLQRSEKYYWWRLCGVCYCADAASIVRRYYEWRAKSTAPLRPQPDQWAGLWAELSRLTDQQKRPTLKQRQKLWGLFVTMRRADGVEGIVFLTELVRKKSAKTSLSPLNPK